MGVREHRLRAHLTIPQHVCELGHELALLVAAVALTERRHPSMRTGVQTKHAGVLKSSNGHKPFANINSISSKHATGRLDKTFFFRSSLEPVLVPPLLNGPKPLQ
jgi:hypothetical protein